MYKLAIDLKIGDIVVFDIGIYASKSKIKTLEKSNGFIHVEGVLKNTLIKKSIPENKIVKVFLR